MKTRKPLTWMGSSKKDLLSLPRSIQKMMGHSLNLAQQEKEDDDCKILKGFGSASVREVIKDDPGGTYRAIYTVRFKEAIYVLHVFQKKSHSGIETPKKDMDLIKKRLKEAQILHNIMEKGDKHEKKKTL